MSLTPRRIKALLEIRERRLMAERADLMIAMRNAVNGEAKAFGREIKRLQDQGQ